MKYLTYSEALTICKAESDKLVKKKKLRSFCVENNLSYHKVLVHIRGNQIYRYPKLVSEFLKASGYASDVKIEKKIIYNFVIDD